MLDTIHIGGAHERRSGEPPSRVGVHLVQSEINSAGITFAVMLSHGADSNTGNEDVEMRER